MRFLFAELERARASGFNWISIGGNSHNVPFSKENQYEAWFAITDFKIYDGKPNIDK